MAHPTSGGAGIGLAGLSAAAFGTSGAFAASLLDAGWTPGAAVTVRVALGALVLTVPGLLALRGRGRALRSGAPMLLVYGVAAVAGAQLCYFLAIQHLSVAVALLLEYSGVLLVVVWMWLRHQQRPGRLTLFGALAAVGGLALVLELGSGTVIDPVGVLWGLGAAVGLATYFVVSAGSGDRLPPLTLAWGGLVVGSVVLGLAALTGVIPVAAPPVGVVLAGRTFPWVVPVLGLSLLAAVVAYVAGVAGARRLGARVASFVGLSEVLFAVIFAWLLVGQSLRVVQLVGGALVLAGIALVRTDGVAAQTGTPGPDPVPGLG